MDNLTVDIGDFTTVAVGDEVTLIGSQGAEPITAEQVAETARHDQLRGHLRASRRGCRAGAREPG